MTTPASLLDALAFAAAKHRDQRRKGVEASPYVNHVIAVAAILAGVGGVDDETLLLAAVLHDTVEDTDTTFEELEARFGRDVADLVREVTDDKHVPADVRKRLQVERAPTRSTRARQLKIADKTCNVEEIAASPPSGWSPERRRAYLQWAADVVAGCRCVNPALEANFDETLRRARRHLDMAG